MFRGTRIIVKMMKAFVFILVLAVALSPVAFAIENELYGISEDSIIKRIKVGEFKEFPVRISNYKSGKSLIIFALEGNVSNITQLDKSRLELSPSSSGNVTLTFFGNNLGKYNGSLVLKGDANEKIPMNLIVAESATPVNALNLGVEIVSDKVQMGNKLKFKVDLQNFLGEKGYDVKIEYSIDKIGKSDTYMQNRSFFSESETVKLDSSLSMLKEISIPDFLKSGEYVLNVKSDYLGLSAFASTRFFVYESWLDFLVLGVLPIRAILLFLGLVLMCGAGFFIYKTKLQKKKRYVSNLNLSLLPKQGARSAFAGLIAEKKVKAFFDIDQLQTHTIIAGSTGGGKTVAAKVLIEEALIKGISVIVFDPTAQWSGMLRRNQDKKMLAIYENYGLKKTDARSFNGNIRTITNPRQIINIKKFMKPGEITIFVVSRLEPKDIDIIVANTVKQVFKADLPENKELKLVILFDEVHRLLPKFGGSGQGFVQVERGAREFRKWGVGLVLISQVLTDFMGEIKANINTEIQMRTRDQGDLDRIKNKYGTFMLQSLLKASTGTGMLQNSSYNNGEPYFISFRPLLHEHARLSDDELANYTKYNDLLDDLEFQIDQLEELKVDVFDMRLELKMALDKVKAGSFNMVEIYLESLLPRIKSEWEKLGMKPKERKIEVISEEELKRDFELAQKEREKAEKKAGK